MISVVTIYLELFLRYHRLRGSASLVLTATGFVNKKWQFSTPTESTPLNRPPKNLSQVITSATPTSVQIRCISVHGRLTGIWVKYNQKYFYLCPLFENSTTNQTRRRIFTYDGSNDADSSKDVPFGIFSHCSPLGGQKHQFWGMNRRNRKTGILSKLLHRLQLEMHR